MTPPGTERQVCYWQFLYLCPVSALRQGEGIISVPSAHSSLGDTHTTSRHRWMRSVMDSTASPRTADLDVSALHMATPRLTPQGTADLSLTPWLAGLSAEAACLGSSFLLGAGV